MNNRAESFLKRQKACVETGAKFRIEKPRIESSISVNTQERFAPNRNVQSAYAANASNWTNYANRVNPVAAESHKQTGQLKSIMSILVVIGIIASVGIFIESNDKQSHTSTLSSSDEIGCVNAGTSIYGTTRCDRSGDYPASSYTQQYNLQKIEAAEKNYDWANAISFVRQELADSAYIDSAASDASSLVELSILYWNRNLKSDAVSTLEQAVSKMRNGRGLGGGCESRAVTLLSKMKSGKLPEMFNHAEINGTVVFVLAPVYAQADKSHAEFNRRMDIIDGMIDNQKGMYEAEARWQERSAKFDARESYRKHTGDTFNPNNPPSSGTKKRDEWDKAKRIYEIFEK